MGRRFLYIKKSQYPDSPGTSRGQSEYSGETINGIPIPTHQVVDRLDATETKHYLHVTYDYSDIGAGTATAADCSLSAFGLPEIEPPGMAVSTKVFIACLIAGIALIVLAVALRLRSRPRPAVVA
jgi:hypothetical protein